VTSSRKDWSVKLEEALLAYRTTFKTPIGLSPFQLVYGKACDLPVKLKHKAYWALKMLNFDSKASAEKRQIQLHELDELRLSAYQYLKIYMEKTKLYHDKKILNKTFSPGQVVLLFNSRLRFFSGKLKSKWSGPFLVKQVRTYSAIELEDPVSRCSWWVNG